MACQVWRCTPWARRPEGSSLVHQFSTLNLENANRGFALSNQSIYRTPVQRYSASQEWEVTNTLRKFKIILLRTIGSISTKLGKKHPCVKGTQVYSKKIPFNSLKNEKMFFFYLNQIVNTLHKELRKVLCFWPICQFVSPVFLALLTWKLKWAFLIAFCLSVCLSACKLFTFSSSSPEQLGQFLSGGDSSLFKWRATPFSKGI